MNNLLKILIVMWFLSLGFTSKSNTEIAGHIKGTLHLDKSWDKHVYLSLIETMERENAVSKEMIVASSPIDSIGGFSILLENIPTTWSLLRLHVVKKESPPASLIIGGLDENHYFIIANRSSQILLQNTSEKPIFYPVTLSGAAYMKTFQFINELKQYSSSLEYDNTLIEREFMEEVIEEKLKLIADTGTNPLVSLYAVYQTDFNSDLQTDGAFYDAFLSKWEGENSSYFKSFRRQIPENKEQNWKYFIGLLALVVLLVLAIALQRKKKAKLKRLSVQERKIFTSIRKGASNQEISDEFNIELSTVKSHVTSIYSKLKVKSRREAINLKIK